MHPYGPVNGHQKCLDQKYSTERLIPPFTDENNVDWRDWDVVTPIRDQGGCGSCWAFSVVSLVESHYAIKYGPLYEFSEQQLVDCDKQQYGCNGGWPTISMDYLAYKGTINRNEYPYTGSEDAC